MVELNEAYSSGAAFVDGEFVPISEAKISLLDWGFSKSDVTYDVVHVWDGAFFRLKDHLARFASSVERLGMTLPHDSAAIGDILDGCVARAGLERAYVAMLATRGVPGPGMPRSRPSLLKNRFFAYALPWVSVFPEEKQDTGLKFLISETLRIPPASFDPTIKNYMWGDFIAALRGAEAAGVDSAILLDGDGVVTEGPGFNLFIWKDGELLTPDRGALEGVTRKTVLEIGAEMGVPARLARLTRADLEAADEVFTATTAGGVSPVVELGGRIYANGRPGPMFRKIEETYWAWHKRPELSTPVRYAEAARRSA